MKFYLLAAMCFCFCAEACVHHRPGSSTYTVDESGCVQQKRPDISLE